MGKFRPGAIALMLGLCGTVSAPAQAPPNDAASLCAVEGQVIDAATNAPVRKALLTLSRKTMQDVRTTASDSAGRFRFPNVPPGEYNLIGRAGGYLLQQEFSAGRTRRSGAGVSLAPGQKLSGLIVRLKPSAAISGRIVDEDGDPLGGVQVQLWRITYRSGRRELAAVAEYGQRAGTDDRGVYRIAGVTPGKYYLSASHSTEAPNWPPDDVRYVRSFYPGTPDPTAAAPIDLARGSELENISLKLSKIRTVHVGGRVGSAAPANVELYPEGMVSRGDTHQATRSRLPDGRFEFDGVLPGTYYLLVRISEGDHRAWAYRSISVGAAGADGVAVSPIPGASITGRMRVEAGGNAMDFSKASIRLSPMFPGPGVEYQEAAGKDGTFKFEDVAPGRYQVLSLAMPPGFYLKTARSGDRDLPGRILDLSAGGPARVELLLSATAAAVSGTVAFPDSSPAADAEVVLIPQENERRDDLFAYLRATTDESGKFTIRDVSPGEYKAFAWESRDYNNMYMDPEFMRPVESRGVAVSLGESGRADIKITLIPDASH